MQFTRNLCAGTQRSGASRLRRFPAGPRRPVALIKLGGTVHGGGGLHVQPPLCASHRKSLHNAQHFTHAPKLWGTGERTAPRTDAATCSDSVSRSVSSKETPVQRCACQIRCPCITSLCLRRSARLQNVRGDARTCEAEASSQRPARADSGAHASRCAQQTTMRPRNRAEVGKEDLLPPVLVPDWTRSGAHSI